MLIAIDGPAASGKGTVARRIAEEFGLEHLDTGRLYRLVGWQSMRAAEKEGDDSKEAIIKAAQNLDLSHINNSELESEEVGRAASIVSAIPEVRAALLELQRDFAKNEKGAVLDGRDIGTVICPNASFKFFITAKAEIRANRRYKQLLQRKGGVKEEDILRDILERDKRDSERSVAPLIAAVDAIHIDTSDMDIDEVVAKCVGLIKEAGIRC